MKKLKTVGIQSIETLNDYNKDVYDLEIKDSHNYFANGHLVHNCNSLVLQGLFGTIYYAIETHELMKRGNLAPLKISILHLKYNKEQKEKSKSLTYQQEIDMIVSLDSRNKFIRNLATDLKGNTLILFQYVKKHGDPLYHLIKERAAEGRKVFFVSGSTKTDDREKIRSIVENEKDAIIVASMGVFSTGINIRNLHNIVFASPSKSQIRVLQAIGRGLRISDDGRETNLYDLVDSFRYTKNHGAERIKLYAKQKFKFKIYEVMLNERQ